MLLSAGINDWGGVSPVTPDFVNPEAPWPTIARLARGSESRGYQLVERLAVYPSYATEPARWQAPAMVARVFAATDMEGFAREEEWAPGADVPVPITPAPFIAPRPRSLDRVLSAAAAGNRLEAAEITRLFAARGPESEDVIQAADELRQKTVGGTVRYVVNRNINYTNVCYFHCRFCAFSKGKTHEELRGRPYDLSLEEVARRVDEAWARGATEVCMQGGIHPGLYRRDLCRPVARREGSRSADPHPCFLAARNFTGRPLARYRRRLLPGPPQGRRSRHSAGNGGRNPR